MIDIYWGKDLQNDSNFFVHEVGQESGVLEHSLEIAEVLRDEDRKPVCTYFGKKFRKIYVVCLLMSLSWQQIKR